MAEQNGHHPFFEWYAGLLEMDAVSTNPKGDLLLTDVGGRRFAVGVHDGKPLLGCLRGDIAALRSISWTRAMINLGGGGRDWIALKARDIRKSGTDEKSAASPWGGPSGSKKSLALWIPVSLGRLSVWTESELEAPQSLLLGQIGKKKGVPHLRGTPFSEIPLSLKESRKAA